MLLLKLKAARNLFRILGDVQREPELPIDELRLNGEIPSSTSSASVFISIF